MPPTFRKTTFLIIGFIVLLLLFIRYVVYDEQTTLPAYRQRSVIDAPVLVAVFYEALCSDSKFFIMKQLLPSYTQGSAIMDIEFVPYGKATTKENPDGSLQFDCQHGPAECTANKYHACTIDVVKGTKMRLDMIACMIKDNRLPREAFENCAKQYILESDVTNVQKCIDSQHADNLLKSHGEKTNALRPPISFIPTITLDGAQGQQASILKDLLGEVCKIMGNTSKAAEICKNKT